MYSHEGNSNTCVASDAERLDIVVLHEVPGRCRLRVSQLRVTGGIREDIERKLASGAFVTDFRFNFACESVTIHFQGPIETLIALLLALKIVPIRALDNGGKLPSLQESPRAPPLRPLGWSIAALLMPPAWGTPLVLFPLLFAGAPIWRRALSILVRERRLNVDFLDGLALVVALLRQHHRTGALMALMVHVGDAVRELTARKSGEQVHALVDFESVLARRLEADGSTCMVKADSLCAGQVLLLLAGDLVPADGTVKLGFALVDQLHITGESTPAMRRADEMVFAGSAVIEGSVTVLITEASADTVVAKIVGLVKSAPVGETRIQNYAELFADRLVAPLLAGNIAMFAATGNADRFMSMAIIDYGTGIRVAAPTSILTSMTRAARSGILIKSGRHIEHLATLRGIAFDKTGTLTCGQLTVVDTRSFKRGLRADAILQLSASVEMQLSHPVARALVSHAQNIRHLDIPLCQDVQFSIGLGVAATVGGYRVQVGSERYLRSSGIVTKMAQAYLCGLERQGHTALLVAVDGSLAGAIALNDEPRPEARAIIAGLRRRGVRDIVMLTGDRDGVARRIARLVGIETIHSEVLPKDKADIVRRLREASGPFAMIGDGVNDSPALAQADVGIALAGGADIARAAADVVLLREGLHLLLPAIDISRDAIRLVRQNFAIVAGANSLALALAIPSGLMSPIACTLLSNGSALVATANALRPLIAKWPT